VSDGEWRLAASSVVGVGHLRRGVGCQDAHLWHLLDAENTRPVLVAVLADGAGSAARSEAGAHLTCAYMLRAIETLLASGGGVRGVERGQIEGWLHGLRRETEALAASEGRTLREFSSTLLAAVVGDDCAAFFQVGDGAMVVATANPEEGYDCVFWPANEEYENITYFATDPNVTDHLECVLLERRVDELALFTDGLQRLALDYATQRAHAPFFDSMLAPLRAAAGASHEGLSDELASFLDSPRVNDRTDDDKTLILASRRLANPAPR
jgi:hypothetical protein